MIVIGQKYAFPYYSTSSAEIDPEGPLAWVGIAIIVQTENENEMIVDVCDENQQATNRFYAIDARIAVPFELFMKDADTIRNARRQSPSVSQRVSRKTVVEQYDYLPPIKRVKDNYDSEYKVNDPIKNAVNKYLGELAAKFRCKSALVLDFVGEDVSHQGALATTKTLRLNGVKHIDVPNYGVSSETAASVAIANVHSMKCAEFLKSNAATKYDIIFLDFCGQLRTNKQDIMLALDRVYTGKRNRGAIFAVTLYVHRTKDEKKEQCEQFIECEMKKRGFFYEPLDNGIQNGGVCTWFWVLRTRTKPFEL